MFMRYLCLFFLLLPGIATAAPPNVILILADDLGAVDLGCYGSKFHKTPQLDRMAREGLRYTRFYASCPVCSPTRAALMTGKNPARLGITDWLPGRPDRPDQPLARPKLPLQLPLEETTLAERFKAAGYATAHIGKWHLGGEGFDPTKQGFDHNIAGDHTGTPRSYFAPFRNAQGAMIGLEKAEPGEYLTDRLTDEALKWMKAQGDKPYFLYFPHYAVHTPMRAKKDLQAKYPAGTAIGKQANGIYAAMLESLDESVGRILAHLRETKQDANTWVIFTSDNGGLSTLEGPNTPATFNGPFREGKGHLYEGGIRVPCIVWRPGTVTPAVTDQFAITADLVPTLLAACDIALKDKLDGVSVFANWQGKTVERGPLFWHYPHYANQGSRPGACIHDGEYKLIEFYGDNRRELFHVAKDLSESRNLAAAQPERVKAMAEKLEAWRKEVGARLPTPNPGYVPNPPNENGVHVLHARTAQVHGTQLRYEPLPHKATLGFWTEPTDYATWELTVKQPGKYRVEILQGCGAGNGGSEVELSIGEEKVAFTVKETGGWQKFEARPIGSVSLKPGRQTLTVRPIKKAKVAVMDLRQIRLIPIKE
jgi:arylsulfatase A-like enzyme